MLLAVFLWAALHAAAAAPASAGILPQAAGPSPDTLGGVVSGLVFDSTRMAPLADARVAVLGWGEPMETGEDGSFRFEGVPAGAGTVTFYHPRLQELGVGASPQAIEVATGEETRVTLTVPSGETLLAHWCVLEGARVDRARLGGVVYDSITGVPVPGAILFLRDWSAAGDGGITVRTDAQGAYRFCNAPAGRRLVLRAWYGVSELERELRPLAARQGRIADVHLPLALMGRLTGRVTDHATGEPVDGAKVVLEGTDFTSLTGSDGRFTLDRIPPGGYFVSAEHLAYAAQRDSITVHSDELVTVELSLAGDAIPVAGLVVTARSRGLDRRAMGTRGDLLLRDQIEPLVTRTTHVGELLRLANVPGLSIRDVYFQEGPVQVPGVCVEIVRRAGDGCRMAEVYLDGNRISNPGELLLSIPPDILEEVEVLSPLEAANLYPGGAQNGVVLLRTRTGR